MGWNCGFDYPVGIACWLGNVASLCFFVVYIPQFILNYKRKSVEGFNLQSIAIKLIGSSFLCINSLFNNSGFPIFLYGLLTTFQHVAFLFQFWIYGNRLESLLLLVIVFIPFFICFFFPSMITYPDMIKPFCQIASHIPQLLQCLKMHSTMGISMFGQHLNFAGFVLGCLMCYMIDEPSIKTWLLYYNSGFQALSIYLVACCFKEMRLFDKANKDHFQYQERIYDEPVPASSLSV